MRYHIGFLAYNIILVTSFVPSHFYPFSNAYSIQSLILLSFYGYWIKLIICSSILSAVLREMFGLKKSAKVIDLSSNHSTNQSASNPGLVCQSTCPDSLSECRLLCPDQASKDIRLFWFIAFGRHLGSSEYPNRRCLIFLNSKSGVRRLAGVLRQLLTSDAFLVSGYPSLQYVNVLHADMIQKQRLRALERFQGILCIVVVVLYFYLT